MGASQNEPMAKSRGLITPTERKRIAGRDNDNIPDSERYQAISRVRRRIGEELPEELSVLQDHHEKLFRELLEEIVTWYAIHDPELFDEVLAEVGRGDS